MSIQDTPDGRRFMMDGLVGTYIGGGYFSPTPDPLNADLVRIQYHKLEPDFDAWFQQEYPKLFEKVKVYKASEESKLKTPDYVRLAAQDGTVAFYPRGTKLQIKYCGDWGYSLETMDALQWITT